MTLEKEKKKTCYLYDTHVENLFICEYMPDAPGSYVKVYLYALMEAERGQKLDMEDLARELRLRKEEVEKAFAYFEEAGVIRRKGQSRVFLSLKEKLYGSKDSNPDKNEDKRNRRLLDNKPLKEMMDEIQRNLGRFLNTSEAQAIISWIKDYGASPEVVNKAYAHCASKGKDNYKYVEKVVMDWVGRGFQTEEDIEEYLSDQDERYYVYKRVMKALGFHRGVTEEEKRIIDAWIDELGCSMDEILKACGKTSGIPNPNINYVNAVIRNRLQEEKKGPARNKVMAYYEKLRREAEDKAREAREDIYRKVPRIRRIEEELVEASRQLTKAMIEGGVRKGEEISRIKENVEALKKERVSLMTERGIPVDYSNVKYRCDLCKDTGVTEDGAKCRCYEEIAREAEAMSEAMSGKNSF